jgi:hypothetical protein
MPSVELTLEQIVNAVKQLPEAQRQELLQQMANLPSPDDARRAARRLRGIYRMDKPQRQRMSELLAKGNAGELTASESTELDALVDEFERKTLELAQSLSKSNGAGETRRSPGRKR